MEYRHKTSPSPRKFKVVASARKVLFTVFWDMEGVVQMEFLEQGQTVNSERYISTLRALKLRLRRVRRDKDSILQHDNKYLKGHHYDNDEEVIADVRRWCRGQSSEFFANGVRQRVKRWRLCVDSDGDYVEK
ncbi:transposase [Plakobranchus ocellatus]|uniref:Transposase n=1 Tax=Plakobranchus ocellatus TaxID=259542 RepID=A0AAV4BCR7_9GAST|nr:transposase [Plakobranchus ocellatus]